MFLCRRSRGRFRANIAHAPSESGKRPGAWAVGGGPGLDQRALSRRKSGPNSSNHVSPVNGKFMQEGQVRILRAMEVGVRAHLRT